MKILLACSAGVATSLLEKSVNDYMKANGIDGSAIAHGSETARGMIKDFDVVLLGPQVKFLLSSFKSTAGNIPVELIDSGDFVTANGENIVKQCQKLLGK